MVGRAQKPPVQAASSHARAGGFAPARARRLRRQPPHRADEQSTSRSPNIFRWSSTRVKVARSWSPESLASRVIIPDHSHVAFTSLNAHLVSIAAVGMAAEFDRRRGTERSDLSSHGGCRRGIARDPGADPWPRWGRPSGCIGQSPARLPGASRSPSSNLPRRCASRDPPEASLFHRARSSAATRSRDCARARGSRSARSERASDGSAGCLATVSVLFKSSPASTGPG